MCIYIYYIAVRNERVTRTPVCLGNSHGMTSDVPGNSRSSTISRPSRPSPQSSQQAQAELINTNNPSLGVYRCDVIKIQD